MGSRFRFFGAGVAVTALCCLLASMTWQYVLGLFVLAGVGCGVWSWLSESGRERERWLNERKARRERMSAPPAKAPADQSMIRTDNVYQFPVRDWSRTAGRKITEAAE